MWQYILYCHCRFSDTCIEYSNTFCQEKAYDFKIISPGDLEYYLDRYNTILIDLREKEDFQKEHIPGAVWADWEKLEKNIGSMLMAYNTNPAWIILYCARGNISLLTARDLARMGYPVISINGGYERWKAHNNL